MKEFYNHLLKQPVRSVSEIAEIVYGVAGLGPAGSASEVYLASKDKFKDIIYTYLDYDRFKTDGRFSNSLSEDLGADEVTAAVTEDYQAYLSGMDMIALVHDAENEMLKRIEHFIWTEGLQNLNEAMILTEANISDCATQYATLQTPPDRNDLDKSYKSAQNQTLAERVMGNNNEDILIYRHDLIEYLEVICANMMYEFWERFFSILSCSTVFGQVQQRANDLVSYLLASGATGESQEAFHVPDYVLDSVSLSFMDMTISHVSAIERAKSLLR